jgi:hypothetical protein
MVLIHCSTSHNNCGVPFHQVTRDGSDDVQARSQGHDIIPVMTDILLYYVDMIAPKWKFNPVNALVSLIKIKNRKVARNTGSVLLIIHTALIYALLLNVVYYDINHHPENLNLTSLALWWLILTVYSRMSFISDDIDVTEALRSIPKRVLLINLLALVISFIGFIWPFYFG